ncbi:MAG: NfeD family protein [Schleiferiaceae bacterium]|nr:NfeD family protein [Schleiferiaceae bacterium]
MDAVTFVFNWEFWAVAAIALLITEIFTISFFAASLSLGCIAAAITASLQGSNEWQLALFSIFSIVGYLAIKPLYAKYLFKNSENVATNADALLNRVGKVVETIDPENETGRIALDGDQWQAVSHDNSYIEKGTKVQVIHRESIVLTVKKVN